MATAAEIQAKVEKLSVNLDRLDGIVNGPATGAESEVVTDDATVKTLARVVAEGQIEVDGASESATLAAAWAEGTEPGGPGTKSSLEWAGEAEDWAEGTEPGGPGTKSSKAHSEDASAAAGNAAADAVAAVAAAVAADLAASVAAKNAAEAAAADLTDSVEALDEMFEVSYLGKASTPITGSNLAAGTYVANDTKPYARRVKRLQLFATSAGGTVKWYMCERTTVANTNTPVPIPDAEGGSGGVISMTLVSGLNTLDVDFLLPADHYVGFYTPASKTRNVTPTTADGGGFYSVPTTDATATPFADSSATITQQPQVSITAERQIVTAEAVQDLQGTSADLQDAFEVEATVNLFDPTKVIDNQVINLSGTLTSSPGRIFLGFQAVAPSTTYTFKVGHWIGFSSVLTFVCLDSGGDDNSPTGAYEGVAPPNGSNTTAPNPPTITFDGYDTATIVMPAVTDVRYIGITTGTWTGHTTEDFDAVVASVMFYVGTDDVQLVPPSDVNFNRLKATHLPTADYLTPAVYPTSSKGLFQRLGDDLYWRTKWSATHDLVQRFVIAVSYDAASSYPEFGGTRLVPTETTNTPSAFTNGTVISLTADDVGPLNYGGTPGTTDYSYFGGSHGCDDLISLTSTAHGKVAADVGSIWSDGVYQFVIVRIVSANVLMLMARNQATPPEWDFPDTIAATLTHVSGATNTGNIPISSQITGQLQPGTVRNELAVRLDGVVSTETGPVLAKTFDLNHRLDIASPASIVTYLENNIGATSWNDDDVVADVTRDVIYRWSANGACIFSETIILENALKVSHRFAAQATKIETPAGGLIAAYVPATDPVSISTDNLTLADVANEFALTVTTAQDITVSDVYWTSPTAPPLMTAQIAKDSGGDRVRSFAIGFVPDRGDAIALETVCTATVTIKSSSPPGTTGEDKFYLIGASPDYNPATRRFDGVLAAAGTAYNATCYRGWSNTEANSDIRVEFWGDCPDGRGLVVLDYAAAQTRKKVTLHPEWAGRQVEIVDGTGLTLTSGDRVGTDGIVVNTAGAGRAVLIVTA